MSDPAPVPEPNFRLPPRLRLKSPDQFQAIYAQKKTASDERLLIFAAWNGLPHPRLGVSVSRKVGNAVVRNRFKRLFREAFRLSRHELPPGVDFILIPRGLPTVPSLAEFQESLKKLASQVVKRLPKPTPPEATG